MPTSTGWDLDDKEHGYDLEFFWDGTAEQMGLTHLPPDTPVHVEGNENDTSMTVGDEQNGIYEFYSDNELTERALYKDGKRVQDLPLDDVDDIATLLASAPGNTALSVTYHPDRPTYISDEYITAKEVKRRLGLGKGKVVTNYATKEKALFNRTQIDKMLSNKATGKSLANGFSISQHNQAALHIVELYRNARALPPREDREGDPNVESVRIFIAPIVTIKDGGQADAEVYITVKRAAQQHKSEQTRNRIYSLELLGMELRHIDRGGRLANNQALSRPQPSDTISNPGGDVKPQPGLITIPPANTALSVGAWAGARRSFRDANIEKVGSGEGGQMFGWGLYGGGIEAIGVSYMHDRAGEPDTDVLINGASLFDMAENGDYSDIWDGPIDFDPYIAAIGDEDVAKEISDSFIDDGIVPLNDDQSIEDAAWRWAEQYDSEYGPGSPESRYAFALAGSIRGGEAVMRMRFFTNREDGDYSHLLDWRHPLTEVNRKRVLKTLEDLMAEYDAKPYEMDAMFGRDWRKQELSGQSAYYRVADFFRHMAESDNPEKDASEALYAHGIDGVRYEAGEVQGKPEDAEPAYDYVAFSDEHIVVEAIGRENKNGELEWEELVKPGNTALSVGERPGRAPVVEPGGDVREAGEGALAWLRRKFVHSQTPVFDAVRRVMGVGREPPDALNVEAAAKNVHGKIRARQEMLQRAYLEPLKAILAQPGMDRKRFDDYALALHALERNRMIQERSVVVDPTTGEVVDLGVEAGSGVTNAWAERVIREVERDPFAAQYKEAANILAEMNRFVLRGSVADGLLTEAQARTWMRLSPHYVPLKSGGAAPGAIHKRATGRFTRPDSVLVNSMRQAYATVRNGELNRVNKTMADWIREYDPNGEQVGGTVPESHKHAKIKRRNPKG